jgi:hypothetical protein
MHLRHAPGAKPGAPTPEVAEAVATATRYFKGEETDFSRFKLDLGEHDPFFERIYAAARRVGWGHTITYGALAKKLGAGGVFGVRRNGTGREALRSRARPVPLRARHCQAAARAKGVYQPRLACGRSAL